MQSSVTQLLLESVAPPPGAARVVRSPRLHSDAAVAVSVLLHILVVAGAIEIVHTGSLAPPRTVSKPLLAFIALRAPTEVALPPVHLTVPLQARAPLEVDRAPAAIPPPPLEVRRADVQPPTPIEPPRREPVRLEPPRAAAPAVVVGAFPSNSSTMAKAASPARQVETSGFDAPAARAPDVRMPATSVGAFDRSTTTAAPQPGTDRPAGVVAGAGFDRAVATAPTSSVSRGPVDAGFGAGAPATADAKPRAQVQASGFGDARAALPAAQAVKPSERVDTPVEILFKPTPDYTDEARAMKLEGEVLLEIEFGASGGVKVLRVVRGLGHGLDETAARAAERIRFKPAVSTAGKPIDFRTTVHIVFRLT